MQNPYYSKGLSNSLYNSSYVPSRSYDDYSYGPSKLPAKEAYQYQSRGYYDDYIGAGPAKPQGKVWSDYIPIEKRYLDYVPQQKVEYMPVERNYTDYLEVEHQMDYVPVPKLHKHIEYIPVEKYEQSYDYIPYEKSSVKGMGSEGPRVNAPLQQGYDLGYKSEGHRAQPQGFRENFRSPNGNYGGQAQYSVGPYAGQYGGQYGTQSLGHYGGHYGGQYAGQYGSQYQGQYRGQNGGQNGGQYGSSYKGQYDNYEGVRPGREGYWQNKYL